MPLARHRTAQLQYLVLQLRMNVVLCVVPHDLSLKEVLMKNTLGVPLPELSVVILQRCTCTIIFHCTARSMENSLPLCALEQGNI
jgi:hypothetical protein